MGARAVLVTGGAGYIGSHACKALAAAGYEPVSYDNLVYGHEWAVKWGPLERGDILDGERLAEVFAKYRPAAAMHFAAFAYVGESVAEPAKYYRNNITGTQTLLDVMRAHGAMPMVFSSSCAVYGIPKSVPISEDAPREPVNPYGATKLTVEHMLADYSTAYGLRSVALRYFNAAGADPDGEAGEVHEPETHLIPLVLDAAAGMRPGITIMGTDYDTPDGTCIRDYIHVADLAHAHVLALDALLAGRALRPAYNLGTGRGTSVNEVIEAARKITGRDFAAICGARRPGDPAALLADPARAGADLGWQPHYPVVDDMIASAWAWHRSKPA